MFEKQIVLINFNKSKEYGELYETSPLKAKMLIKLGKAIPYVKGSVQIKDLYWCGVAYVADARTQHEKGGRTKRVYKTKRVDYGIGKKIDGMGLLDKETFALVGNSSGFYGQLSNHTWKNRQVVDYARPLKAKLKSWKLWSPEWTDETVLTPKLIARLEEALYERFKKNINNTDISAIS